MLHRDAVEQENALAGRGDLVEAIRERSRKLWRWFSVSHLLRRGVWVVMGDPLIRIGERVQNQLEPSDFFVAEEYERLVYYVERVVQDYSEDSRHYLTHVALTRGAPVSQGVVEAKDVDFRLPGVPQ